VYGPARLPNRNVLGPDTALMTEIIHPVPDIESAAFWNALREHTLMVKSCGDCGELQFPPRPRCRRGCEAIATWHSCSGGAKVVSWVITHKAFHPAFEKRVPYVVLLVQLVEQADLMMYGNYLGDPDDLQPGFPVTAVFEDVESGLTLLQWRAADAL
jgi:uncharacterized protein